jgi:hypothetical protein
VGVQHLQCDVALQPLVHREVDRGHAAPRKPRPDGVAVVHQRSYKGVRHVFLHPSILIPQRNGSEPVTGPDPCQTTALPELTGRLGTVRNSSGAPGWRRRMPWCRRTCRTC